MSKKQLKIAFITDWFYPDINGVVTYLNIMISELEKQGHKITVYTHRNVINLFGKENIKVVRLPSLETPLFKKAYLCFPNPFKLRKSLLAEKPDIIHLHTIPSPLTITAMIIAKQEKIPVVATFHAFLDEYEHYLSLFMVLKNIKLPFGGKFLMQIKKKIPVNLNRLRKGLSGGTKIKKRIIWQVLRTMYNRCNLVIAQSELSARKIEAHKIKCLAIPCGVDIETFRIKKSYARTGRILSVCRLANEKKLDILIKAFSLFVKTHQNARLTLVGDGPARNLLVELTNSLCIQRNVSFEGKVKRSELQKYFETHDFFANTSDSETFGYVIAEAMAAGLPIIAVDAPGSKDLVRHGVNGFLAKPNCIEDFAKAMEKMMDKKANLKEMGSASRRLVKNFSVENGYKNHVRAYRKLLKESQMIS